MLCEADRRDEMTKIDLISHLKDPNATSGISLFMYQIPKGHFPDDRKQEKPDYPSLLSAVSRAGGRELKWTPASPMSLSDEAGS